MSDPDVSLMPREDEALGVGTNRLFGLAWAGEEAVDRVEISTDSHTLPKQSPRSRM